ncbi:hypothetical protein C5167_010562 [Papaver somniferum]|uniref:Uncharacterized protein n=1 Tax=Papaver somniferum TaxID=3469 RepID=A0A4Y7K0K3_PAPSO|nr:hypothetical protein C5167_010562 [Papaver somniferum]
MSPSFVNTFLLFAMDLKGMYFGDIDDQMTVSIIREFVYKAVHWMQVIVSQGCRIDITTRQPDEMSNGKKVLKFWNFGFCLEL